MRSAGAKVSCQLVIAKNRLAPVKKTTIPRLELLGCLLGARLAATVTSALDFKGQIFFWSDSTTALQWIRRTEQWGVFVNNRVQEIRKSSSPKQWRHVPVIQNPADLPSRGCSPSQLVASSWWEGPSWLKETEESWPAEQQVVNEDEVCQEMRRSTLEAVTLTTLTFTPWYVNKFSSYPSLVRVMGWVRRFIGACQKKKEDSPSLTAVEYEEAERIIFKCVQEDHFQSSRKLNVINGIQIIYDGDGLARVKTKLLQKEDTEEFKLPVILPSSSPIVERLIQWEQQRAGHAGVQITLNRLRERVWIIGGRKTVKRLIGKCVVCRRFAAKSSTVEAAALPSARVTMTKAFETTGVDLAGPLFLKDGSKSWIIIFTCAVFRCVHLELATSLSTESFILAMWKFVNRRGRPSVIYSDNGTNLVRANNAFAKLNWTRIRCDTACCRIEWRFNPPTAAWWGGFWERLIRILKDLLKRMLGQRKLTFFQLDSCVVEVEGILNERPLTYVSEDASDLIPLTPSVFLKDLPVADFPEAAVLTGEILRGSARSLKQLRDELKRRFRKEYLSALVHRGKPGDQRKWSVGEVVFIGADNQKRLLWSMGRIEELIPGRDSNCRVAKVKTANGVLIRPLQRLFPLEVQDAAEIKPTKPEEKQEESPEVVEEPEVKKTKSGRITRKPDRLAY